MCLESTLETDMIEQVCFLPARKVAVQFLLCQLELFGELDCATKTYLGS